MWEGGFHGALLWENLTFDTSYLSEIELGCQLLFYTVELDGITCFATLLFLPAAPEVTHSQSHFWLREVGSLTLFFFSFLIGSKRGSYTIGMIQR